MQIQLCLRWRPVLISLGFYDHWMREANVVFLYPSPLPVAPVARMGRKEEVGCDIWVQQTCWRREFAVIALTSFRAVNDSGLSATNLSACLLFTKLLFYGPVRGAAACLSTDQEIISIKHRLWACSHTKTVMFRALIHCMDLKKCSKPFGAFTRYDTKTLMGFVLVETGTWSVCLIIKMIRFYSWILVFVVCYMLCCICILLICFYSQKTRATEWWLFHSCE